MREEPTGKRRRLLTNLCVALVSTGLALLGAEAVLHLLQVTPLEVRQRHWEPHPSALFYKAPSPPPLRLMPNATGAQVYHRCRRGRCVEDRRIPFTTNRWGHRDVDHELNKPSGTRRIVVLGDSFTMGDGVLAEETYPRVLEDLLDQRFGGAPDVEVINMAVLSLSTWDESHVLQNSGLRFDPDLAIVGLYLNDVQQPDEQPKHRSARRTEAPGRPGSDRAPVGPASNVVVSRAFDSPCRLCRFVQAWRYRSRSLRQTLDFYEGLWSPGNEEGLERFEQGLERIRAVQDGHQVPVLVVIWPWLHRLDDRYPFEEIHDLVATLCAEHDLATLDLLPTLRGLDADTPLWAHESDHHPSPELHRIAAETIVTRLMADESSLPVTRWGAADL